jgi:hypothetical protein
VYIHPRDARHRRSFFNLFYECHEALSVTLGHNFHGSVLAVANVSLQAESASHMLDKISEANPLNSSVHSDLFGLQCHDRCEEWGERIRTPGSTVRPMPRMFTGAA